MANRSGCLRPRRSSARWADLARRGTLAGLQQDTISAVMVPAGTTPWPWLVLAGAWLLVWPGVIALRVGLGWWESWLPWWLVLLAAGLHMFVLAGPVIVARRDAGNSSLRRRFGQVQTLAQMLALDPAEFEIWIGMLFRLYGYRVRNTQYSGDHGVDIEVSKPPIKSGLVQCKRYRGTVGERVVRELYGTMIHERGDCAWLATTGAISRQAHDWATGKPIELWDGQKIVELARKARASRS